MNIGRISWDELAPYLAKARGQSRLSLEGHKNKFKMLQAWFQDKDFNARTFSVFLSSLEEKGYSAATQNNCIKLVKHLSHYLGMKQEFEDFKYVEEGGSEPEYICSFEEIKAMAEVDIEYSRYRDRKIKHKTLVYFLGVVGSRINETLKLEWRDVVRGEINLVHFRREVTKFGKERYCAIPKWLLALIDELPHDNSHLFSRIEVGRFRVDLKERAILAGVPYPVRPHTLRDSSINNKLSFGMPIEEVANYHGHSNIDTTYKYYVKILAAKLAQSLTLRDPAFVSDQTYETCIQAARNNVEKVINPQICDLSYRQFVNEHNKRVIAFQLIEK